MSFITNRAKLREQLGDNNRPQDGDAFAGLGDFYAPQIAAGPSRSAAPTTPPNDDPLAGAILGMSKIISRMGISHPCTVMRRQCQVHQKARSLHTTPVTLAPVVCNMVGHHGVSTFWRGSIGTGVLWGMEFVTETLIADVFGLPKSIVDRGSQSKYWKHVLLKATTSFLLTPFYISSFIETIRSGKGLASGEDNRVLEVLVKGVDRCRYLVFGPRDHSRKFSVLYLVVPTVCFRTSHYVIQMFIYGKMHAMARDYVNRKPASERTKLHEFVPEIFAGMTSSVLTDLILFPAETVLHRLYVQGTRTLIDDMDSGIMAISMKGKYDGFFDCAKSIVSKEGVWALYAGVGAVILDWGLQYALHQFVRACFNWGREALVRRQIGDGHHPPVPSAPQLNNVGGRDPFAQPSISPIASPRRNVTEMQSPPRAPGDYPTFGELSSSDPLAQFAASSGKPLQPLTMRVDDPLFSQLNYDRRL